MKLYYYLNSQNQQCGPLPADQLAINGVTSSTMVWSEGMPAWAPASSVPELLPYLQPASPMGGYGMGPTPNPATLPPSSNMVWAILTTILCCLPFGVVAIVYASKVDSLWAAGQHQAAYDAANKAKNWSIASAASAAVVSVLYILFAILAAAL